MILTRRILAVALFPLIVWLGCRTADAWPGMLAATCGIACAWLVAWDCSFRATRWWYWESPSAAATPGPDTEPPKADAPAHRYELEPQGWLARLTNGKRHPTGWRAPAAPAPMDGQLINKNLGYPPR